MVAVKRICKTFAGIVLPALALVGAVPPVHASETCRQIPGDDVLTFATQFGFSSSIAPSSTTSGSCRAGSVPSVFSLVAGSQPISCEISLLKGRRLAAGWSIVNYAIDGTHQRMDASDDGLGLIRLELNVAPTRQIAVRVKSIDLEGPDCDRWKDAFRQSRELATPPPPPEEEPDSEPDDDSDSDQPDEPPPNL